MRNVVAHFFNNDITIPVWAIFETFTLGEFGTLYDCVCTNVKLYVSNINKLPTILDSDGMNTQFYTFTVKDLRNELPINIYNQVVGTQHTPNMLDLQNFISMS